MKTLTLPSLAIRSWIGLIIGLLLATPAGLVAQSDDFNDGNDNGWTRYDPLRTNGAPPAVFSFPGGNSYRIQAPGRPAAYQLAGQERAGAFRSDNYTNFYISVDVVNWSNNLNQAFGILARIGTPGVQTTKGYVFTIQVTAAHISISRLLNEAPTDLVGSSKVFVPNPSKDYRMVFIGKGSDFTGKIYELPNLDTAVITTGGTDSQYSSGVSGLVVADLTSVNSATGAGIDATFDNYSATDLEPPKLTYEFNSFMELILRYPLDYSAWTLRTTRDLTPPVMWTPLPTDPIDGTYYYIEPMETGNKFFQLIKP